MKRNDKVLLAEPEWALRCVRNNSKPSFGSLEEAREAHERAKGTIVGEVIAEKLAREAWDRLAMQYVRKAKTEKELELVWKSVRRDSEPERLIVRKITRIRNQQALAAKTLSETFEAARRMPRGGKRWPRVRKKIDAFLAGYRKKATTMEDFQRICYYAEGGSPLHAWAKGRWNELSLKEIAKAKSLKQAERAHERTYTTRVDGILSWGWDGSELTQHAAAKWDALASKALKKATTKRRILGVLLRSRKDSTAGREALDKLWALQEDFETLKKLYYFLCNKHRPPTKTPRPKLMRQLSKLCVTAEQASWLYENFRIDAGIATQLVRRFPDLDSRYRF